MGEKEYGFKGKTKPINCVYYKATVSSIIKVEDLQVRVSTV